MSSAVIVAHRGLSALYPENTLPAIEQAIAAGARAVEFDVQFTADKVPVLFHDTNLVRMTGQPGSITGISSRQLHTFHAKYPERFADRYAGVSIASLEQTIDYLRLMPLVTPCIEIKTESIEHFDVHSCVETIIKIAEPVIDHALLLSFSREAIELLHSLGIRQTGWILKNYNSNFQSVAESLQPQVLVCGIDKLPDVPEAFWPGPWDWMIYQTEDPEVVSKLIKRGARYVETDNVMIIAESLPGLFTADV